MAHRLILHIALLVVLGAGDRHQKVPLDPRITAVLDGYAKALDRLNTSASQIEITGEFFRLRDGVEQRFYEHAISVSIRRQGAQLRASYALRGTIHGEQEDEPVATAKWVVYRPDIAVGRTEGEDGAWVFLKPPVEDLRNSLAFYTGPLDGYSADFGAVRIDELLRRCRDVQSTTEDGLLVIKGDGDQGTVMTWWKPEGTYHLLQRVHVVKDAGDRYVDQTIGGEGSTGVVRHEMEWNDIEYQAYPGCVLPVSGSVRWVERLTDGQINTTVFRFKRTQLDLAPDLRGAFEIELPNGLRVSLREPKKSGKSAQYQLFKPEYEWFNGGVRPRTGEGVPDARE